MKKRIFGPIVFLTILASCNTIQAKFEIINLTENKLDSVNIRSFDHEQISNYLTLKPGQTDIYYFNMTDIPRMDGDYLLSYKDHNANIHQFRFGYFNNGIPLEKITMIKIKGDTVLIDQILSNY